MKFFPLKRSIVIVLILLCFRQCKVANERLIVPEPPDCMGCDQTVALVFVAESIGNDTLLEKIVGATLTCNDTSDNFNSHVVIVR